MEDPKIYDDPNILLGEELPNTKKLVELPNTKKLLLTKYLSSSLPLDNSPNPEGLRKFKKWFHSGEGFKWREDWKALSNLSTDEYIWIYSHLPDLILQSVPAKETANFEAYQHYRIFYKATAAWMYFFAHKDRQIPSKLEESEDYKLYKNDALRLNEELNLCQKILLNQKFKFGGIFYKKAIFLWLWMQIAKCKDLMQERGIANLLKPHEIVTKRDANKQEELYLNMLDGLESQDKLDSVTIYGISGYFDNLPGLIFCESAKLASGNDDLSKSLSEYTKAARSVRHRNTKKNPETYQLVYAYQCATSGIPKVFTTGLRKKLPPQGLS